MNKKRYIFLILGILITLFIFINSLMPSDISSNQSGFFVVVLKNILNMFNIKYDNNDLSFIIRKGAHITQFFLFSLFWFMYYYLSNKESYEPYILTLNYGLLTAMTDEFIQYFTPGRAMQIEDVLIDLFGVALFLFIAVIVEIIIKRKIKA